MKRNGLKNRICAILCLTVFFACQVVFVLPDKVYGETAGEALTIRVQYLGEREEKIRTKAVFSRSELEAMGASVHNYSNVTRVGTVMSIVARGPELLTIIERAGVDINSIDYITFRTTDGEGEHSRYTRNFYVGTHMTATRYFYPHLTENYERSEDGLSLTPLRGTLNRAVSVPSILALEYYSTKNPGVTPDPSEMTTANSYRFCLGQTPLTEGQATTPGYDGGDVSAMESAVDIFGIDITLLGSPVKGINLDLSDTTIKVGSQKKIGAVIEGDELFEGDYGFDASDLTWSSSDPSIAAVDENGIITVKKEGEVVITATAPNGMTASVTINGKKASSETDPGAENSESTEMIEGGEDEKLSDTEVEKAIKETAEEENKDKKVADKKQTEKKQVKKIVVKEVSIGGLVSENVSDAELNRQQMAEDAQALGAAEESSAQAKAIAGALGLQAGAFGIVLRIRKYFMEV